jgi:hypothetical protein
MWRRSLRLWATVTAVALLVVLAGATEATATGDTVTVSIDDDGAFIPVGVGDEVSPVLPLSGSEDPGWFLASSPDASVVRGGDNLRYLPSEPGQGTPTDVFSFMAAGVGETVITLIHASSSQSVTFIIMVGNVGALRQLLK